nr:MAG TPA: hypothetical protein [Caudoviricetes sp.]
MRNIDLGDGNSPTSINFLYQTISNQKLSS